LVILIHNAHAQLVAHENKADASIASMHLVDQLMPVAQDDLEEGRVKLIARTSPC
jgi:hypothetical protein